MAITVAGTLRASISPRPKPGAMKTAITVPGPVSVSATGTVDGGSAALEAAVAANRTGYWGYALNATNANEQPKLGNGAIVEGFAGVVQGSPVYVADDGTLTHTIPAAGVQQIGVGVRATAIYFYQL